MNIPFVSSAIRRREQAAIESARSQIAEDAKREFVRDYARAVQGNQLNPVVPNSYPQVGGSPYPLYGLDRPLWYSTPNSPKRRQDSLITVETIRQFADTYDVMRACINQLKREVVSQVPMIGPVDAKDESNSTLKRVAEAKSLLFPKAGILGERNETRRHYELKILEDMLVIGAFASWKNREKGGTLTQAIAIDAGTIRPRMDAYGWPGPKEEWYEQWILGMKITGFPPEDLTYDGLWPVTHSPWFRSPVEYLISCVLSALKSDEWNRVWLTDGNTPSDMIGTPPEWTPAQIKEFAEFWDALMAGNSKARQRTKFVPGGASMVKQNARKDQDFGQFDLWLLRRCCAIFGVQPASIGFVGEQYKVTQDASMDATSQFSVGALLELRKEHYDDLLADLGYGDLEILAPQKEEDPAARTDRLKNACGGAYMKLNEARKQDGLEAEEGGDVILVQNTVVPLEQAVKEPEAPVIADTQEEPQESAQDDLNRWMRKALNRVRRGKSPAGQFTTTLIDDATQELIREDLEVASSEEQVRRAFSPYLGMR